MKSGGRIIFNPIGTDLLISQDSIDKQQGYPVIKASQLVQKARHQLTAKELKLIDFMVSKVRRDDSGFRPLQTTIKEINQVMEFGRGTKSLTETSKSLLSLSNKGFWFQKDEDTITIARWLQTAEIKKDGSATLELDEKLAPWLLKLVGSRAQYSLSDIVALRSKYSLMLYQLPMSWRGSMGVNGTPDEFLEFFGHTNMKWWQFNGRYLQPAIDEINQKTGIKVHYAARKSGRTISEVEIDFTGDAS